MHPEPALLVCKSLPRVEGESMVVGKIMIIGHMMNSVGLFILMPGGSGLPSPDTAASKGYVTRILLAAVLEG
jgi:hypothetical protein